MENKNSGIYIITNSANNKKYIGSSINVYRRHREHKNSLINNKHYNIHLQGAFNKYGRECFSLKVIERNIPKIDLFKLERYYIVKYKTFNPQLGYNMTLPEDDNNIREYSAETLAKMSKATTMNHHNLRTNEEYEAHMESRRIRDINNQIAKKELEEKNLKLYGSIHHRANSKEVTAICYKTNKVIGTYNTLAQLSKDLGISEKTASLVLNHTKNNYGTKTWQAKSIVIVAKNDYDPNTDYTINPFKKTNKLRVLIRCRAILIETGEVVGEYDSPREMAIKLGLSGGDVLRMVQKSKASNGYYVRSVNGYFAEAI